MTKEKKETAANVETETSAEKEQTNAANVEVPENAEEITNDEALEKAADEVNKLRDENTTIKQALDEANAKIKELEEKKNNAVAVDNSFYIQLLNDFEKRIDSYSEIRRERLRREFVTDLKEEIARQREKLTNA